MNACFYKFTLVTLCILDMATLLRAGDDLWMQTDLEAPRFDPLLILDPKADSEASWARHVNAGNRSAAAAAFVEVLRHGPSRIDLDESIPAIRLRWFGTPINKISSSGFDPDDLVNLRYTGTYDITHQFEDEIDWNYDGSEGRTPEWIWQLNRHFHWIDLADAYRKTGDARYARAWEKELRSWIQQSPRPADEGRRPGSAWRTLDTGIRAGSTWPYVFEIFRHSSHVSDEAMWLLFAGQRENALHLQKYPTGGNWKIMESNGLGYVGFMFPEMRDSALFAETAVQRHHEEIEIQFYPDGTHQEFAPHYAAAGCITNFYALASIVGQSGTGLPDEFWDNLELMVSALARIADPEGIAPPLHNSHVIDVKNMFEDVAVGPNRERYWTLPKSDLVPYGGYAVFRREHSYALFDAGPRGTSHYHDDDLQLLTYAYGRFFGIDPSTPNYTAESISLHLRTSAAHNVVLMDGKLHQPAIEVSRPQEPMPISFHGDGQVQAGAARRTLVQNGGTTFDHERVVLDIEGLGWVVFDRLFPPDDQPHSWEWIWNMPVDSVTASGSTATAFYENGPSMVLASVSNAEAEYTVSKGGTDPFRGWMNTRDSAEYLPIHAVRYLATKFKGPVWAVTLQAPFAEATEEDHAAHMSASQESNYSWLIAVTREDKSWRFRLSGDEEIRRIDSWKNGESLDSISAGDHTLRERPTEACPK